MEIAAFQLYCGCNYFVVCQEYQVIAFAGPVTDKLAVFIYIKNRQSFAVLAHINAEFTA